MPSRRTRCSDLWKGPVDLVAGLVEHDKRRRPRDGLLGDEQGHTLCGVVVEDNPVGEAKLDAVDSGPGVLDRSAGTDMLRPPSTRQVDPRL